VVAAAAATAVVVHKLYLTALRITSGLWESQTSEKDCRLFVITPGVVE